MTLLDIDVNRHSGGTHVVLSGELDLSTVDRVEEELGRVEAERPAMLVLDLSRLTFLDSSGLRLVVGADQRARDEGRRFVVVRGTDTVQRVFSITHLDERIELVADVAELELQ